MPPLFRHHPGPPAGRRTTATGFSLIELMVAVALGMAAVIVMMQMLLSADTSKRITSGSSDAQVVGTVALYNLERDLRMGGYGISAGRLIGCDMIHTTTTGAVVRFPLVPVLIEPTRIAIPDGDDNSDVLLVVHGDARESADGDRLLADTTGETYSVTTVSSFQTGQLVVAQAAEGVGGAPPDTPCTVQSARITGVDTFTSTLTMNGGEAGRPANSVLYNLGRISARAYAVRHGTLTMCDFADNDCTRAGDVDNEDIWIPIASNIVALRAQYGRDLTPGRISRQVTYTTTAPGRDTADAGLSVQCTWARTLTLRVALVARGSTYDKDRIDPKKYVTPPAMPTWSGNDQAPIDLSASATGPAGDKEWQKYRYKVFETNVPLRNSAFQGDGC